MTLSSLTPRTLLRRFLLGVSLLLAAVTATAQPAGEVEFSRGVGFVQTPGQLPRTLGKGMALSQGDRLTTSDGSTAIIKLNDGTRMTLRPNSEMVVQQYQFKESAPADNAMTMQLLRGGFRAITGLISKGSSNAAKVQTATATIGIRGTDFDARVCAADCKAESEAVTQKARTNSVQASAKLVSAEGDINAVDGAGSKRSLVEGGSVYPGEIVEMGAKAKSVLAFRDETRITLGAGSRFRVDNFVFDDKNPTEGRFLVSLLRGSLRALTGLIGRANNRNVGFTTPTATIGIRGTGLDLDCDEIIGAEGCRVFTWQGSIEVTPMGQTMMQTLQAGQGLFVSRTAVRPITTPPLENLQRPDAVPVNTKQLFTTGGVAPDEQGLYVYVRDGHIEVTSAKEVLQLGRGETGFAANDGRTGRPQQMPLFIQFDKVPLPNSTNPNLGNLLGDMSKSAANQCR